MEEKCPTWIRCQVRRMNIIITEDILITWDHFSSKWSNQFIEYMTVGQKYRDISFAIRCRRLETHVYQWASSRLRTIDADSEDQLICRTHRFQFSLSHGEEKRNVNCQWLDRSTLFSLGCYEIKVSSRRKISDSPWQKRTNLLLNLRSIQRCI